MDARLSGVLDPAWTLGSCLLCQQKRRFEDIFTGVAEAEGKKGVKCGVGRGWPQPSSQQIFNYFQRKWCIFVHFNTLLCVLMTVTGGRHPNPPPKQAAGPRDSPWTGRVHSSTCPTADQVVKSREAEEVNFEFRLVCFLLVVVARIVIFLRRTKRIPDRTTNRSQLFEFLTAPQTDLNYSHSWPHHKPISLMSPFQTDELEK